MKELIIVRHGEADHMVKGLTGGWCSVGLTKVGTSKTAFTLDPCSSCATKVIKTPMSLFGEPFRG